MRFRIFADCYESTCTSTPDNAKYMIHGLSLFSYWLCPVELPAQQLRAGPYTRSKCTPVHQI
jgi:hypothetical protein